MTPEERFAQIESILLQNTSQIATLLEGQIKLQETQTRTQQQLEEFIRDTRASIEDLVQMGLDTYQLVTDNSNAVRTMQSEVRGLQVENRRILQELRDRRRAEN